MHSRVLLGLTVAALLPVAARADSPAGLRVFPASVELRGKDDRQSIVVQLVNAEGVTTDVTSQATLQLTNPALADIARAMLTPRQDGSARLLVEHGEWKAEIPVVVTNSAQSRPVSFRLDVMPVFMKHGCNNGSCHGAARGKDGFMLSLFGYDPAGDYFRLTRQIVGRRTASNRAKNGAWVGWRIAGGEYPRDEA